MSERRMARSHRSLLTRADGQMPACLQLGHCVEVWAEADVVSNPQAAASLGAIMSARHRFATARGRWLTAQGIDPNGGEGFRVIPDGGPWSIQGFIGCRGDGDPEEVAVARFAAVGVGLDEIYEVRAQAADIEASDRITGRSKNAASRSS